jgi:lysozyme
MKVSQQGVDLIKQLEGFSAQAYRCPAGKLTIGYGHMLQDTSISEISSAMAEALLKVDIERFESAINRLVRVPLSQNQFDALVSLIYNIGIAAFSRSILLKKLNKGDFSAAADEFDRWVYVGKTVSVGLQSRRKIEKSLFINIL